MKKYQLKKYRLTIIARILDRAVHSAVREHLQVSVFDEHFYFPGRARYVGQVGRWPAVPGRRGRRVVRDPPSSARCPFSRVLLRGPISVWCTERRAQNRATAAQQNMQHQQTDRHRDTTPPIANATAAATDAAGAVHARPFHHVFRPFPGGTGQGTSESGSVATDAGARLGRRPHANRAFWAPSTADELILE